MSTHEIPTANNGYVFIAPSFGREHVVIRCAPRNQESISSDDAPSAALAFLEAAEIDNSSDRHLAAAWRHLREYEQKRKTSR